MRSRRAGTSRRRRSNADRLLACARPLINRACAEFHLREPDVLQMTGGSALGFFGQIQRRPGGRGVCMTLSFPDHDPMLLYTMAHELAHLGAWKHGKRHNRLTLDIMDFWQKEMTREVLDLTRAAYG